MAATNGDLTQHLIDGGVNPITAKIIANALANAGSPQFSQGRDITDSTPTQQLRLITPDTRRYQLTNLDYSPAEPFQERIEESPGQYQGSNPDHPYKDSQPVVSAPPLANPRVQAGDYINVDNVVESGAAVSKVGLKLRTEQGRHPRLDPSTKSIEGVPFITKVESKHFAAEFTETDAGTELKTGLRNTTTVNVILGNADTQSVTVFSEGDAVGPNNGAAGATRPLTSITVLLSDGQRQPVWAWQNGNASAAESWFTNTKNAAGTLRAWVVFNGTRNETDTGASTNNNKVLILAQSNVASVFKRDAVDGTYEITMTNALPDTLYAVIATAGAGAANEPRVVHLRTDGTNAPTPTTFRINVRTPAGNNAADSARVNVAVFE